MFPLYYGCIGRGHAWIMESYAKEKKYYIMIELPITSFNYFEALILYLPLNPPLTDVHIIRTGTMATLDSMESSTARPPD